MIYDKILTDSGTWPPFPLFFSSNATTTQTETELSVKESKYPGERGYIPEPEEVLPKYKGHISEIYRQKLQKNCRNRTLIVKNNYSSERIATRRSS